MESQHRASLPSLRPVLCGGAPIRALAAGSVQVGGESQSHVQAKHNRPESSQGAGGRRRKPSDKLGTSRDVTPVLSGVRHVVSCLVGRQQLGLARRKLLREGAPRAHTIINIFNNSKVNCKASPLWAKQPEARFVSLRHCENCACESILNDYRKGVIKKSILIVLRGPTCSHIQRDGRSTFQASPSLVVGHHLQAHGSPTL